MKNDYTLKERTTAIIEDSIERLFPREVGRDEASEKPKSAQLVRLLTSELAEMNLECVHQVPIVPRTKRNEQVVDLGIFVDGSIAVVIEYKPVMNFAGFLTQSSVYATDNMASSERPCLMVQVQGKTMSLWKF
jgi:hypothetical protein